MTEEDSHQASQESETPYRVTSGRLGFTASWLERAVLLVFVLSAILVMVLAHSLEPDPRGHGTHEQLGMRPCSFKIYTGYPCLTCGMTTAFSHMAHLEILDAFTVQPAGAILFLMVLFFIPLGGWCCLRGRSLLTAVELTSPFHLGVPLLILLFAAWGYVCLMTRFG